MKSSTQKILFALMLALLGAALIDPLTAGRRDFIAYWSAFRLLHLQLNPYSPADLQSVQSGIPASLDSYMPFRSPPFAIVALSPVLALPWAICIRAWFGISLFALVLLIQELSNSFGQQSRKDLALTVLAVQQPILACLYWGQLGIVEALAAAYLLRKSRGTVATAVALTLLICKPHPYYVFLLVWAIQADWKREGKAGGISALIVAALSFAATAIHPQAFALWWEGLSALKPFELMKPTLIDWMRLMFGGDRWTESLSFFVPAAVSTGALLCFKKIRGAGEKALMLSIPISFVTAPYCWHHDMVLLLVPVAWMLSRTPKMGIRIALGALAAAQLIAELGQAAPHAYVFVPLAALGLLFTVGKRASFTGADA